MDRLPSEPSSQEIQETLKVAKAFRGVLVYFGLQYLLGFCMNVFGGMAQASPDTAALFGIIVLCFVAGVFYAFVMLMVNVYRFGNGVGGAGVLWVIAMFLPCLNLITLLVINSKGKSFLEQRGVKVGFLGPSPDAILQLERRAGRSL
jgi:hypothetical protein